MAVAYATHTLKEEPEFRTCLALLQLRHSPAKSLDEIRPGNISSLPQNVPQSFESFQVTCKTLSRPLGGGFRNVNLSVSTLGGLQSNAYEQVSPYSVKTESSLSTCSPPSSASSGGLLPPLRSTATVSPLSKPVPPRRVTPVNKVTLEELRNYFDMPIVEVAKHLGICTTLLKKMCRQIGIKRWPHRQIRSLRSTIACLRASEARAKGAVRNRYREQAELVEAKLREIIENPDGVPKFSHIKRELFKDFAATGASTSSTSSASSEIYNKGENDENFRSQVGLKREGSSLNGESSSKRSRIQSSQYDSHADEPANYIGTGHATSSERGSTVRGNK